MGRTYGYSIRLGTDKGNVSEATRFIKTMRRTGTRAQRIILANAVTFRELCRFIKDIERTPTITELRLNYQFTRKAIEADQNWREAIEKTLERVASYTFHVHGVMAGLNRVDERMETGLGGIMAALDNQTQMLGRLLERLPPPPEDEDELIPPDQTDDWTGR